MNILSLDNFSKEDILSLIYQAKKYRENILFPTFNNIRIANLFFETSTRTLLSFNIAEDNFKIYNKNIDINQSAIKKHESLKNMILTLKSLGFNMFVIRNSINNYYQEIANMKNICIINAGEGTMRHPSQALLDAVTISDYFPIFNELKILIIGDLFHSRVFRSNSLLLQKLGAKVYSYGPVEWKANKDNDSFDKSVNINNLGGFKIIMFLRAQNERHETFKFITKYNEKYGLNKNNIKTLDSDSIILHPGPINEDVEIMSDVMLNKKIKILEQVRNGIYTRMALISYLIGISNE